MLPLEVINAVKFSYVEPLTGVGITALDTIFSILEIAFSISYISTL